jgi:hypothetical protein
MNLTEDRLRAALMQTAEEIPPASIAPLTLPQAVQAGLAAAASNGQHGPARRTIKVLGVPAAAAVAVFAVIAASLALVGGSRQPRPLAPGARSVPPYYLTSGKPAPGHASRTSAIWLDAVLHDTFSGRPVATIHLPRPYSYISNFAGSANDRTFVIAGQKSATLMPGATAFFLARFDPANRKVTVTDLHIPKVMAPAHFVDGIALSPAGTRLAIAIGTPLQQGTWAAHKSATDVMVYSLPSGDVRLWTAQNVHIGEPVIQSGTSWSRVDNGNPVLQTAMSWSRSGMLAFNAQIGYKAGETVWLLNTSGAEGSLLGHSRLVLRLPGAETMWDSGGILTPDGTKIVAALWRWAPPPSLSSAVYWFSAATGKRISVRGYRPGKVDLLEWTNSSGNALVEDVIGESQSRGVLGVLIGNRFTPLRGVPAAAASAQVAIVF